MVRLPGSNPIDNEPGGLGPPNHIPDRLDAVFGVAGLTTIIGLKRACLCPTRPRTTVLWSCGLVLLPPSVLYSVGFFLRMLPRMHWRSDRGELLDALNLSPERA